MKALLICTLLAFCMLPLTCSKNDVTPNDKAEQLLKSQIWKLREAKVDEVFTSVYDGLTLSFGSKTYTTANGAPVWKPSGTWDFADKDGKIIRRDDGLLITIITLTGQELEISFTWSSTSFDGGRSQSLSGLHVVKFNRQ